MPVGVATMILLTVAPVFEAAHFWIGMVLWLCLVYFVFEWLVRLRHMANQGRLRLYVFSSSGVVDALGALAVGFFHTHRPGRYAFGLLAAFVAWEIFEIATGAPREANYISDTALDLLMDSLGALVAYGTARLTIWKTR